MSSGRKRPTNKLTSVNFSFSKAALARMQTKKLEESIDMKNLTNKEQEVFKKFVNERVAHRSESLTKSQGKRALTKKLLINSNGNRWIVEQRKRWEEQRKVPSQKKKKEHPKIAVDSHMIERII